MVSPGSLFVNGSQVDIGTVSTEAVSFQCGLWDKSLPLLSSENNVQTGILGKRRMITISGVKTGTQAEIESFLSGIDSWVNTNGTVVQGRYYPLYHPDNTSPPNQTGSYYILPDTFEYEGESGAVSVLKYTLVMIEGVKVL